MFSDDRNGNAPKTGKNQRSFVIHYCWLKLFNSRHTVHQIPSWWKKKQPTPFYPTQPTYAVHQIPPRWEKIHNATLSNSTHHAIMRGAAAQNRLMTYGFAGGVSFYGHEEWVPRFDSRKCKSTMRFCKIFCIMIVHTTVSRIVRLSFSDRFEVWHHPRLSVEIQWRTPQMWLLIYGFRV